ncbi:MAG: hypothetical protein IIZ32_03705 [Ruminococcus sp.]|nr:hypothetical protein [Ruminococcus sp.]
MREILFRGKRIDNDKWIEGSLVVAGDYCCILPADENSVHPTDYPYLDSETGTIDGHLIPVDPSTVGQYTGLTDKNGKKIFEGDIVDCLEYYGEVYYDPDCCFDIRDNTSEMCGGFIGDYNSLEVVGNIHDNSELLEDKP